MSDLEIARLVRLGRRQGFSQACTWAFFAMLVAAPLAGFAPDAVAAVSIVAGVVLGVLAVGSAAMNQDSD